MGAVVTYDEPHLQAGESIATVVVAPGVVRGITLDPARVPSMVDELPLLACMAALAEGETLITGAAELRVKESDRIATVVSNLRAVGAEAEELPDGMRITGRPGASFRGHVTTHGDHRIAMAFGVLGAASGNAITIDDPACVDVSFPGFWTTLAHAIV